MTNIAKNRQERSIAEVWGKAPQSKAFPGFEATFGRVLLDPIELLMSYERIEQCVEPSLRLLSSAPSLTELVHPDELMLLHGTVVGLSTRLPEWARQLSVLRRLEWAPLRER